MTHQPTKKPSLNLCWTGRSRSFIDLFVERTRMPAIKPSSTKLAIPWQTTLRPSNTFNVILWASTTLSIILLWQCPVPVIAKLTTVALTGIGSACIYRRSRRPVKLQWQHAEIQFSANDATYSGQLASGSYCSTLVIVLAVKDSTGHIHRVPVWRDSVDASDYSWLLIRLKTTLPQALL